MLLPVVVAAVSARVLRQGHEHGGEFGDVRHWQANPSELEPSIVLRVHKLKFSTLRCEEQAALVVAGFSPHFKDSGIGIEE
jgi:hypothetical protein